VTGQWFSPDTQVSSTNKTDRHNITEILLKVIERNAYLCNQLETKHLKKKIQKNEE
jgi:hypothetical protein